MNSVFRYCKNENIKVYEYCAPSSMEAVRGLVKGLKKHYRDEDDRSYVIDTIRTVFIEDGPDGYYYAAIAHVYEWIF